MKFSKWELLLHGAHFYESTDDGVAESFYERALESAQRETEVDSAATALVLHHFAEFLSRKGRATEAAICEDKAKSIICAYASEGGDQSLFGKPMPDVDYDCISVRQKG